MTKISELKPGQGSVNIEVTIKSLDEPRTFNKFGKDLRVANAIVTDGESEIKLTLWNDDINKVKVGVVVKITNGYVSEFQGEKQLTTGKFGKLEISGEGKSKSEFSEESQEEPEDNSSEEGEDY